MITQYTTATSGTITALDSGQDLQLVHDAGVTASISIAFPATPVNGQKFGFSSIGGIVTLSLSTTIGSIANALTTLAGGGTCQYMFLTAQNKWYKIR